MKGCVTSYYDPSLSARILIGPDGLPISTTGSTTQGLQEGINYAIANHWPFRAIAHEVITCSSGISIPPCANADIDLGATEIHFQASVNAPAIHLNSFNGGRFSHKGRMMHFGSPNLVVYIAPINADPIHGQKIIQNADIQFGEIRACAAGTQKIVQLDLSQGEIINNQHLDFLKLDGWNGQQNCAQWGLLVNNPANGLGFNENHIRIGQLMGFYEAGVQIGLGDSNAVFLSDNYWDVNINSVSGSITSGFTTFGGWDYIQMCVTAYAGSHFQYALIYRPGSCNNRHHIRQSTAQFGVSNSGSNNAGHIA